MQNTKIEWATHTFNPWIGCTKVSPGCAHCYAEARDQRFAAGIHWGKGAPRQRTSESNWKQPLRWNAEAAKTGIRPRVFCASLADWLDDDVPADWLADLTNIIWRTPNLDWLLLTKRPENWRERLIAARGVMFADPLDVADHIDRWLDGNPWRNVWIGTTVEDQMRADERIPLLLDIPAGVRFLSCEPLLGPVNLLQIGVAGEEDDHILFPLAGEIAFEGCNEPVPCEGIHWVICGGESGKNARPMHPDWARSLRGQCQVAGVPFFFKQWGEYRWLDNTAMVRPGKTASGRELDGQTWDEIPVCH